VVLLLVLQIIAIFVNVELVKLKINTGIVLSSVRLNLGGYR